MGKGVVLTAPFKRRMTIDEWRRMVAYIDGILAHDAVRQPRKGVSITKR